MPRESRFGRGARMGAARAGVVGWPGALRGNARCSCCGGGPLRSRVVFTAKDEAFLELNRRDDYYAIVRKLGAPAQDRWRSETGERGNRQECLFYLSPRARHNVGLTGERGDRQECLFYLSPRSRHNVGLT